MKKEKVLSPEKAAKLEAKRQKEIARLEKEKAKPKFPGYLAYFILIITIVYIADEITTQIGTQMQSILASQIFAPIVGEEFAVARMSALGAISGIFGGLAFLYKPLSDKYGRKKFLVINTLGMGIGMVLVGLATNIPVYIIGASVIAFFVPHDMQATYIYESTPAKHRGKIYSVIKAFATFGMLLIPVLRDIFIPSTDLSQWRYVYLIPAAVAIVIAIFAMFFVRESDAFVESKLRLLKMTEEEKEAAKAANQDVESQGGLIKAIKYIAKHKQLRWLSICWGFFFAGMLITMYYESILNTGYAQQFIAAGTDVESSKLMATSYVTQALLLFPVGSGFFQLIQGFFADKFGRKAATIIMSVASVLSFLVTIFGSQYAWNPYVVGFFTGAAIGSFWAAGDIVGMMGVESSPTNLRVSIGTVMPIFGAPIMMIFMGGGMVAMNIVGDAFIPVICLATAVPSLLLGAIFMLAKVKETKGADLGVYNDFDSDTPAVAEESEETVAVSAE